MFLGMIEVPKIVVVSTAAIEQNTVKIKFGTEKSSSDISANK